MRGFVFVLLVLLALVAVLYVEVSVWNECLSQHSWLYCMRTLSK